MKKRTFGGQKMVISIVFSSLFLMLFAVSFFLIKAQSFLHNKFRILMCLYIMVTLQTLYIYVGNNSKADIWNNIIVLLSLAMVLCILTWYVIKVLVAKSENVLNIVLIATPIIVIEIIQLVFYIIAGDLNIATHDHIDIIFVSVSILCALSSLFLNIVNTRRDTEYKKYIYSSRNSDIPQDVLFRYSERHFREYNKLSEITFKLYNSLKSRSMSLDKLREYLDTETDLPESLKIRVLERYTNSYNLSRIEQIGLLEFANLIFPEFYTTSETGYSSQKYESRLFEEYYYLLRKNLRLNTQQYESINEKLEQLLLFDNAAHPSNGESKTNTPEYDTTQYAQSIVREINHCIKTPLLAIKYAIQNLSNNADNLSDAQIDKIKTASGNIAIIQSILNGYRKLVVFADDSNPEKITEHILTAVNALNQQNGKKIKLDITSFVEPKNAYGNNIVTIMLLPLVHNAYEASPANETINVSCRDKSSHFLLRVENLCDHKVNVENLAKDGFTTKEKGGEGLRSVRRISESLHFDFSIKTYESGRKVVATLKIPKSQEVTVDDK